MNNFALKTIKGIAVLASTFVLCASASAGIVYDNTTTSLNQFFFTNAVEYGDQVTLGGNALERVISQVQFQYFATNLTGGETALFRLYAHANATSAPPSTLLFDSGSFAIANGQQFVTVDGLSVPIANNTLTWAVTFSGLTGTKQAGLELYDPPTTGSSFKDFWIHSSDGTWSTFAFSPTFTPAGNFAARITAVPEAGTIIYALFGGLLFAGYHARRRTARS
jgi:hypothetical protein